VSAAATAPPPQPLADERLAQISTTARLLRRPEIGALLAAIVVAVFFWTQNSLFLKPDGIANWTDVASTIGIPAVVVALLMIGGEFDLSAGVAVVTSALVAALTCFQLSLNVWVGVLVSLIVALGIGFLNGYLVVRTGIPSFLITLATFFSLRGINLAVTKGITGTVASDNISELDGFASAKAIFASDIPLGFMNIKITVVWWLVFTALASWILLRTRTGNWIFAVGGNAASARAVGVPVPKVKIGLFMGVGSCAGSTACTCCSTPPPCNPASASATSSATSSLRSWAGVCSPAATAPRSAPPSARSSSA
jgi:simple sugar transport system permease protein